MRDYRAACPPLPSALFPLQPFPQLRQQLLAAPKAEYGGYSPTIDQAANYPVW